MRISLGIFGKAEDKMKRIIISLALGLVFISLFSVWAYASADATSPPVASLNILTYPERTVYGAFEQLDVSGLTLRATIG